MKKYKDWYECKGCGYAFDTEDIVKSKYKKTSSNGTSHLYEKLLFLCKDCCIIKNRKISRTYYASDKGGENVRRAIKKCYYKFKKKSSARHKVWEAIKKGKLIRLPCEKCGNPKSQAHHEDYSKPLKVMWLCPMHHYEHEHTQRRQMRKFMTIT
jgi:hypothetical protein